MVTVSIEKCFKSETFGLGGSVALQACTKNWYRGSGRERESAEHVILVGI